MALHFVKPEGPAMLISDRRLLLAADNSVVEANDPAGVKLLVGEGSEILVSEADRLGLKMVNGKFVLPKKK